MTTPSEVALDAVVALVREVPEVLDMLNERSAARVVARMEAAGAALPAPGSILGATAAEVAAARARVAHAPTDPPAPPPSPFDGSDE